MVVYKLGLNYAKIRIVEVKIVDNKLLGLNENLGEKHKTFIKIESKQDEAELCQAHAQNIFWMKKNRNKK